MASIQRFDLLRRIFGELIIAQAVYDEAVVAGRVLVARNVQVLTAGWITTTQVKDRLAVEVLLDKLDLGEAETIVLACVVAADRVLMDEKKGGRKLTQLGLQKIGTVGILLKAKQVGLIPALRPELDLLRQRGFGVSQGVIDAVLRQGNE